MYKYTYKYNPTDNSYTKIEFQDSKEYSEFLRNHCKTPGEYNLSENSIYFYKEGAKFNEQGYYINKPKGTKDYIEYWSFQKELFSVGLIIDDVFICGNHYLYLNFLPISDKVKKKLSFPDMWDTDIYTFNCNELAKEVGKFLIGTKSRQRGVSLKFIVEFVNRLYFQENQSCKFLAYDQSYIDKSWTDILENYRNFLNTNTAFYRGFNPDKMRNWKQAVEVKDMGRKRFIGTMSTLVGLTFKDNPAKSVGGNISYCFADEVGIAPNLDKLIQYVIPALRAGSVTTGHFVGMGSVGELKDCEPLKQICYNPIANNTLDFPNNFENRPEERIGFFIPSNWSYFGFIDKYGNSDVKGATEHILAERETLKKLSIKDYQLAISQNPLNLSECFGIREESCFPTEIIQPQYEKLCRESPAIRVTLIEDHGKITHKLGSEAPPVTDLPVKKDTDKRGCVEMIEPPLYDNPPIGLYYGSCDPVTQIKTQTSDSLQSFGIYRADFYQNDVLIPGERVAWYCGRYDNVDITYEICRKLMHYYNARTMIESDKDGFIKWLINKKENLYIMKRSEYPRLQEVIPNSKIYEDYGIKKGSSKNFENHLLETIIRYVTEELSTDYDKEGNAHIRYGVERIKDKMLLKEMLDYNSRGNFDRIWEFAYQLDVAEGNTIRQRLQKIKEDKPIINNTKISISQFNNVSFKKSSLKIKQF